MLFRVLDRLINIRAYMAYYIALFDDKIAPLKNDYRRFIECFLNLIIFKLNKIKEFFLFNLNVILYIIDLYIISFKIIYFFIKRKIAFSVNIMSNIIFFFLECFSYDCQYLFMEFIVVFPASYILSFKYSIKKYFIEIKYFFIYLFNYPEGYEGSFALEIYPDEYQEYLEYRELFEKAPGPDLNVYYPMRFALSSVMIRITGVILSVSLILILFFNFTNLFIIVDSNFHELRRTLHYRFIESFHNFMLHYKKYYIDDIDKYTNTTFYSLVKSMIIIIYTKLYVCLKYLYFDAYIRFDLIEKFKIQYYIYKFFFNFFVNIFIFVLPIHIYYVVYHSFKIIYISTYVGYFFDYLKKFLIFFFKHLYIVLKKIWQISYDIMTVEEPPIEYYNYNNKKTTNIDDNAKNNNNSNKL